MTRALGFSQQECWCVRVSSLHCKDYKVCQKLRSTELMQGHEIERVVDAVRHERLCLIKLIVGFEGAFQVLEHRTIDEG